MLPLCKHSYKGKHSSKGHILFVVSVFSGASCKDHTVVSLDVPRFCLATFRASEHTSSILHVLFSMMMIDDDMGLMIIRIEPTPLLSSRTGPHRRHPSNRPTNIYRVISNERPTGNDPSLLRSIVKTSVC